ncbi:class I SAM-dependent methyltransferase [Sporolactobacillus nakayamae]|uniref:Ubiquinone/menaquinone biosynthesis C-methylase UbiE n=1 Tax=Sporolactobacillus nakayamae TaxID=269670 RepID=A0A1I2PLL5_9BACL|nr:class I SAM-dependent methyltransferase [Sporolactobacillus nakayamae]SFG16938.1 Ubiquinone/menaquinone biosynthesis C-methylase UbiE [Sporolactobacillus nakayamae]
MDSNWSDYVQTSEELYRSRALRFHDENKKNWLNLIRIQDGMSVLEVGCGSGLFAHRVKTYLPHATVTGLDFDLGHIAFAKAKSHELGLDCTFVNGDATAMPFADQTFDLCYSFTVMEHIEPNAFLREQYRVLKTGGTIAVLTVLPGLNLNGENWRPSTGEEQDLFDKAFQAAPDAPVHVRKYPLSASEYAPIMEKNGFTDVNVEVLSIISYAPDNADISDETAIESINVNRLFALNSVEKVLKLNPAALTDSEHIHLNDLINQRFDERIDCYKIGEKLWDIATSNVVAITGSKR